MAPTGLLASFVAAIQASLSVLLVICYGGLAAWLGLLNSASTRAISKVCVRLFLPALLFTKIGAELQAGSAQRYGVVLGWAVAAHAVSFAVGIAGHLLLGMPDWTTVAVMFNNTTSYPLLLVGALEQTGILQGLVGADEPTRAAMDRAKSYFLVFSTVSSCLTFAVGPRLIDSEHAAGESDGEQDDDKTLGSARATSDDEGEDEAGDPNGPEPRSPRTAPTETSLLLPPSPSSSSSGPSAVRFVDPFLPSNQFFPSTRSKAGRPTSWPTTALNRRVSVVPRQHWVQLGPRTRWWLLFAADFFNAPLLGALAGAVVGLSRPLHRAFFSDTADGGILTAWLTASLDDIGGLFVPLPVVVAGVSLYTASLGRGRGGDGGERPPLPWATVLFILVVRFVVWPVASIGTVYVLASRSTVLGDDPMLWFALMLMPTGPPAMKLITLVQVSNADAAEETSIAQLLTISYLISPILSLTVVGSLRACQACMKT